MNYITPEKAGIKSESIEKYINVLEERRMATHDIIIAKGDNICFEAYWKPFHKDFQHRMYSISKSFVGIAIGFLEQDGLINLDDPMIKHFSKELEKQTDENMRNQTIRHMLLMSTAKPVRNWFDLKPKDRVAFYFENDTPQTRPSGTINTYDSEGSFILGALVERITGKPFMEYLYEKLFCKIGVSKDAYCLKSAGGHSWGDSAVLCTPMELLKVARFMLNKGKWNGEQILNEKYVTDATSCQIFNNHYDNLDHHTHGYGYQIWRTYDNSFFFNGMGCQFAICVPDKDLVFVYNADNQGKEGAQDTIIRNFFEIIAREAQNSPLPENKEAQESLAKKVESLELICTHGEKKVPFEDSINGATYIMDENPMGITKFRLVFDEDGGKFEYTNAQGDKVIPFGKNRNVFSKFPQEGYANEVGTVATKDFYYDCCASASWVEEKKIFIKVQVIDKYFGNLSITIGFRDNLCGMFMNKSAEDFLREYEGYAGGKRAE